MKKKKKPGPKPGSHPRRRIKPPVHPLGEALLRHARLIADLEASIASARDRLARLQMDEVETLERIRESLQATLNMHQLSIQELRETVAAQMTLAPNIDHGAAVWAEAQGGDDSLGTPEGSGG